MNFTEFLHAFSMVAEFINADYLSKKSPKLKKSPEKSSAVDMSA